MNGFLTELKRRNVIRMAGLYLVGAWLLVQVAGTVLPTFDVPGWVLRTLIILLAIGLVPTLIFSWVFELTPDGLKREEDLAPGHAVAPQAARRMDRTIIVVLALALAYFAFDKFVLTPRREAGSTGLTNTEKPKLTEAQRLTEQARALIDDDPLVVRENYKTAYELCERAETLSPDDGEIWATMARANIVLIWEYNERADRQKAAARSQVERAIRLAPQSVESGLAMALFELENDHNPVAAKARLVRLLAQAPNDRRILRMLIYTEEDRGQDVAEAARWMTRANALPGGDAPALVQLAWVHWGLNQLPELLELVNRSLAIQPTSDAYHLKLLALFAIGELGAARDFLRQVPASILREDRLAYIAYNIQLYSREPEQAVAILAGNPRDILEEGRFFNLRGYLAGNALLLAGKPRAAEVEFRAALKALDERLIQTPRDSRLMYFRSRILARLGDKAEATRYLDIARELGRLEYAETETCVLLGRNDETIASFDQLIDRKRDRWPTALRDMKQNPIFDPLRNDPRFQEIVARGDRWLAEMMAAPARNPGAAAIAPKADEKSVAVLAFTNLSDDKGNEYFSDGISEELLNVLAKVPGLKVTARTSSFHFKGKDTSIPEIAQQLGVAYVVEGSVRKQGDKVRITAQLIKAADGFHAWSDTFTRDLKDIFAVQDEIAGLIAKNLKLKLEIAPERTQANPEAYGLLLQGRFFARRESNAGRKQSIDFYRRAIGLEPGYALAWAEMAQSYIGLARFGGMTTADGIKEARLAAQKSLELDPDQPIALDAMGWVQRTADWDWRAAQKTFQRALALAPENSTILTGAAILYFNVGRIDEAVALARQATERDPLNAMAQIFLADLLMQTDGVAESIELMKKGLKLAPEAEEFRAHLAIALTRLKRYTEADALIEQEPNEAYRFWGRGMIAGLRGDRAAVTRAREALLAKHDSSMTGYVAMLYAAEGNSDEAFAWLERSFVERDSSVCWVKTALFYDSLRNDARWPVFLRKLGLTDDQLK